MNLRRMIATLLLCLIPCDGSGAEGVVFRSGDDGFHTYRIPAIAVTNQGTVLALCEGRTKGSGDAGDIDLLLRRSVDQGTTWGPLQTIWSDGAHTCGNPCVVVDCETGEIWLLATWNRGTDHEREIINQTSEDTRRIFAMRSVDDGATWSTPYEITADVKLPNWTWYATGPGSGIQMRSGEKAGRLVIPCDHIVAETKQYFSHVIISDDHGQTWRLGGSTPHDQVNECQVCELSEGQLLLNMRNYAPAHRLRQLARSNDGGDTWIDQRHDPQLVEPICQAAIESVVTGGNNQRNVVLFSNPADAARRVKMTLRASFDGAQTWPIFKELHAGPSAYSDIQVLSDGRVLCLFECGERGPYESIRLAIVDAAALAPPGARPAAERN